MIENKIIALKQKINNKNLSFDEDDIIILNLYPELIKDIFILLSESMDYWTGFDIGVFIEQAITYIPTEVADNFWINYIKNEITNKNQELPDILEDILEMINVKEETRNTIREMVKSEVQVEVISKLNEYEIIALLEEKRYDLIALIDSESYHKNDISEETMERLISEFPYNQYESPIFFSLFPKLLEGVIDKLSLKTLVALIYKQYVLDSEEDYKVPLEILREQLIRSLKEKKLDEVGYLKENLDTIYGFIPYDQLAEIAEITIQNNILDFMPQYYEQHPEAREFCCTKIIEYFDKTNNKDFFRSLDSIIQENEILVDSLIENGFIEGLITNHILEKYPNKVTRIIENIKSGNPKYQKNEKFILSVEIYNYFNILEELLKSGIIKKISLYRLDRLTPMIIELLLNTVKQNPNLEIDGLNQFSDRYNLDEIAIEWLKQNNYRKVLELFNAPINNNMFARLLTENEELVVSAINNSLYFSSELIKIVPTELFENKKVLAMYFKEPFLSTKIINYIDHHEEYEYMYNHETFLIAKGSLATNLQIDIERLNRFEQKFGPKIIRYINNENILNILRLNEQEFENFMSLFPNVEYTMNDLESVYDSLKQYEFSKKQSKIINIFPTILHAIEDNNNEIIVNAINEIYGYLDASFFKEANQKYVFPEGYDQTNPKLLVEFIIEKIKNNKGEKKEKYIGILHEITDYYISKKREEYRDTYDMTEELKLPYTLEQKSIDREFFKVLIEESFYYSVHYIIDKDGNKKRGSFKLSEYLVIKLEKYGLETNLAKALVSYNNVLNRGTSGYSEDTLKSNYKFLIKAMNEISKEEPQHEWFKEEYKAHKVEQLNREGRIKRKYNPGPTGIDIYEILTLLRINVFKECVLSDTEVYESLKTLMNKKKIHLLPDVLKNILGNEGIDISGDLNNIAAFISYYGQIYEKEKNILTSTNRPTDNININFTNILINAEVYSGVSSVYSQILGSEDAKLIKANPGPNRATSKLANNGRLKEAIELTEKLFRRQRVTIPTFNECFKLTGDKSLRVVAGNFTHPSNLTHGERTGACMRIGGVGESLFQFAINNQNGFHIRFEDPKTGKYISRVTGFRNGNTVFLNELRHSCDPNNYSDENVIEACKKAAEMLIELSKNSSSPIENVVVSRAYATLNMPEKNIYLNVKNIKEGLPPFYTDVNSLAIVLATTAKKENFVPVNLDNTSVPEYLPAREIPIIYKQDSKASGKIMRISSIKRMLEGKNYEHIAPLEFENGLIYAIVSEDWYIYVDELGNIHKDYIDMDPRAKEELVEYLIKFETEMTYNLTEKEKAYGI